MRGSRMRRVVQTLGLVIGVWVAQAAAGQEVSGRAGTGVSSDAKALVERAVELMGGPKLEALRKVRLDMVTQWQRTSYRRVPWTDRPSFEHHVDVRDYSIPAWRNTRDFGSRRLVNVVRDSVAISGFGDDFRAQSIAYVDERNELFMYTPDRLMLLLRDAGDVRPLSDTVVGGERFRMVGGTVDYLGGRLPVTVGFQAGSGLPAYLRFRRGHPNDFGLVPFGDMWVEVWYSNWRTFGDVAIPTQWDIQRAGAPYKRMTVEDAVFGADFAAPDSFAVTPGLREAFLASRGPMHDRPVDSTSVPAPGLVQVHAFGFPAGAVQVGRDWVLLEAGHAPLSLERGLEALEGQGVDEVAAAVVVAARAGNGGVVELVEAGVPVYTSVAEEPFIDVMLSNSGVGRRNVTVVREGRWLDLEGGRLRLEPVDLPDTPGSLLVYSPSKEWVYARDAYDALDLRIVMEKADSMGWRVSAVGTGRDLWSEVPRPR